MEQVSCPLGAHPLIIETGRMAKQAHGAVVVSQGETVVLVTVVGEERRTDLDFLPLTVEYRERMAASGKIPGGFFKREGRPSTKETLTCRMIDRPLRPRFPKTYTLETQVMATVLSADRENDSDVLSIVGASAALELSQLPFEGPIAGVRVGRVAGQFVVNPTKTQLLESDMDIIVAGTRDAIVMVEGGSEEISEDDLVEALFFGHRAMQPVLDIQEELRRKCGRAKVAAPAKPAESELHARIRSIAKPKVEKALKVTEKIARHEAVSAVKGQVLAELNGLSDDAKKEAEKIVKGMVGTVERDVIREWIVKNQKRVDGRDLTTVRPINIEVGLLPRVHGSALFTRGETQALGVATLGTRIDEQKIDALEGDWFKTFILHYTFPPFSVGETNGRLAPGRREIGHGALAERAVEQIVPSHDDFPYTIRITSEVLESNGSSSMATVCASSLSLMDAGVPITAPVAGIAMGLIQDADKTFILSDILGDEDHCGDMDFKVAGTRKGITACQMDIKIKGLKREVVAQALSQAKQGRFHILDEMDKALPRARSEMSPYAPRITSIQIPVDKIRDIIGPGGKMIRAIQEETGATINVEDDGTVLISSANGEANADAIRRIEEIVKVPEVGEIYTGKVVKVADFGAFVQILPGRDGLVHISELEHHRVERVTDVLREGDEVKVIVKGVDPDSGKVSLSRKALLDKPADGEAPRRPRAEAHENKGRHEDGNPRFRPLREEESTGVEPEHNRDNKDRRPPPRARR